MNKRIIKFRVWWTKQSGGVYGYERLHNGLWQHRIVNGIVEDDHGWIKGVLTFGGSNLKKVVREQFTGFKDKNGKEIYEGDIVEDEHALYKIDMTNWPGRTMADGPLFTTELDEMDEECKIIGNICENPELLK